MKFSAMLASTRTVVVHFLGEEVQVAYKPQAITPRFLDALSECKTPREAMVKQCSELVERWDVVDDDGRMIAPSVEFCQRVSTDFLAAVVQAIREDRVSPVPQTEEKKASGAG